jgi:hypothetical protein
MGPFYSSFPHARRSIGDDAEIDFGPISSGGAVLSAAAGIYDKQPTLGLGNRAAGL